VPIERVKPLKAWFPRSGPTNGRKAVPARAIRRAGAAGLAAPPEPTLFRQKNEQTGVSTGWPTPGIVAGVQPGAAAAKTTTQPSLALCTPTRRETRN
jgi:hypothetical protein